MMQMSMAMKKTLRRLVIGFARLENLGRGIDDYFDYIVFGDSRRTSGYTLEEVSRDVQRIVRDGDAPEGADRNALEIPFHFTR